MRLAPALLLLALLPCPALSQPIADETVREQSDQQIAAAPAEDQGVSFPPLWQGLAKGMSPEAAIPTISAVEGVKSVRVRRGNIEATERVQIRHDDKKISIARIPFELSPQFEHNKLKEAWLSAVDQCSNNAVQTFETLATGLVTNYPERLVGPEGLRNSDVSQANLKPLQSGEPAELAYAFANDSVAAILLFQFSATGSPPYPVGGGNVGAGVWQLAQSLYEQRRAECSGTGNRRMNLALRYIGRADLEALVEDQLQQELREQQAIADKL